MLRIIEKASKSCGCATIVECFAAEDEAVEIDW